MRYKLYIIILVSIFYSGCIEQIDFPVEDNPKVVVVDGTFSDVDEIQTIKLSHSVGVNLQIFDPISGANVRVEEACGHMIQFSETEKGIYTVYSKSEVDKNYRLNAILPDGRRIYSRYQGVRPTFPVTGVYIADTVLSYVNESGKLRVERSINCFAHSQGEPPEEELFLRYDLETVWQMTEAICSPLETVKTCYVYDRDVAFNIDLLELSPGTDDLNFERFIFRRKLDGVFGEVFSIKVDLLSYNEKEYRYWETLKTIFEQSGSVIDILPARLPSLIELEGNGEVFGHFAVVGKSSYVRFIRRSDFNSFIYPYCGAAGVLPYPFPQSCCDCASEPGASLFKPEYW
ncbi:MAG: DUF4249 family protein [Saprospiraceae bacterium]|nr:DUF4249 family protein [Saprospiraceae bacterium]